VTQAVDDKPVIALNGNIVFGRSAADGWVWIVAGNPVPEDT